MTTIQTIIAAADRLVRRDGVARLTIDAVAREAGLSKGGVLYHFPSKEALIKGMLEDLLTGFDDDVRRRMTAEVDDDRVGRFLRAYVRASSADAPTLADARSGLLAALAADGDLMGAVRQRYDGWQREVEADGVTPALATLVRLAADGLWFADLLGLAAPSGASRDAVLDALLTLTQPDSNEGGRT